MKVVGINGSPRKRNNSGTMLEYAINGAKASGAETEMINLVDLRYSGCSSCFACKKLGGKSFARCAVKDDLSVVLSSPDNLIHQGRS